MHSLTSEKKSTVILQLFFSSEYVGLKSSRHLQALIGTMPFFLKTSTNVAFYWSITLKFQKGPLWVYFTAQKFRLCVYCKGRDKRRNKEETNGTVL